MALFGGLATQNMPMLRQCVIFGVAWTPPDGKVAWHSTSIVENSCSRWVPLRPPCRLRRAQDKRRIPKVGVLWHAGSAEGEELLFTTLIEGFRKLGYVDGRTIILEHRFPNEVPERFKSMAAELVALQVDVLMSSGNNAAPYAKNATATIPVVAMLISDPV